MDAAELFEEPQEYATANLPAFGLKRNSEAFLAAAVSGDSDLTIEVRPALETSAVPLNAASFRFVYRQSYKISPVRPGHGEKRYFLWHTVW